MSTTPIPGAAVAAAHAAVTLCMEDHRHAKAPWACCIEAGLTAALPLLGEHDVEYGAQVTNPATGSTYVHQYQSGRETTEEIMRELKPEWQPKLVARPLIIGEWTEVEQ